MAEHELQRSARRLVSLSGCHNFRDLGGYPISAGGMSVWGRVYRSDSLHLLTDEDLEILDELDIRTIIDLRRRDEREENPGRRVSLHFELPSRRVRETDPRILQTREDGEQWLFEDYCGMLASGGPTFGAIFRCLSDVNDCPVLFHCYGGKDRTGLTAALLLSTLGVDRGTVLDDYELTSHCKSPEATETLVVLFMGFGFGRPAAEAMVSTPRWAMDRALGRLDHEWGGVHRYITEHCGVPSRAVDDLRHGLVTQG